MAVVNVIGAGLAGCEAACRLAKSGIDVRLYEMKPVKFSPAHSNENFAELVCSNSLKAIDIGNASGLLKEEMRILDSVCVRAAYEARVPAGQALAVDRNIFAENITREVKSLKNIRIFRQEAECIADLPPADAIIVATGPLTSKKLADDIKKITGVSSLSFFDAAAPVIFEESIDKTKTFRAARYGKGSDDYINCPMNKEEYEAFYEALINAETADVKDFDSMHLYEGCMPVECMAARGRDTLKFGPLKPVGLKRPDGTTPYAVVQLRQDNESGTLYNIVGFQTRLKFPEQRRVFGMIPGLENAEYARYGVMHRNTYLKSPGLLDGNYNLKGTDIYFAGQITGVEGYMESAASGIVAGIAVSRKLSGNEPLCFPASTVIGALANYISGFSGKDFQPMGANFGIMDYGNLFEAYGKKIRDKALKKKIIAENALSVMREFSEKNGL